MDKELRKELKVSAIENGTVIDHIPAGSVFKVMRILNLEQFNTQILIGANLDSRKYGKKGILKLSNRYFEREEINKIALVASTATLIVIRNFEIIEKREVQVPDQISNIVKCVNPNCITNHEQIPTRFCVIDKESLKLQCCYCEKTTARENISFI